MSNIPGGWGGIRTPGGVAPTTVFKTVAIDRSATHPKLFLRRSFNLRFCSLGAPGGAAHHSFARGGADACHADSYARPSQSTAATTHPKLFLRRSFNLRFCSLGAPGGAAHHSFARGGADACHADSYARPSQSTAATTHPKLFLRRSFNLRFCSLGAPDGAAHHSFARGWALFYIIFYETQSQKLPHQQKTVSQTTTDPWSIPNWLKNQSGHLARGTVHRIF